MRLQEVLDPRGGLVRNTAMRPAALTALALAALALVPAAASAHPLGNFSVNQYEGLTLRPDRVEVAAVVDAAEIPTMQDRPEYREVVAEVLEAVVSVAHVHHRIHQVW